MSKVKIVKKTKEVKVTSKKTEFKPIELLGKTSDFYSLFKKLSIAMSKELTRYYLNSILFEKRGDEINFVSTDGHKMVVINAKDNKDYKLDDKFNNEKDFSFIIPRQAIDDFLKLSQLNKSKKDAILITFNETVASFNYISKGIVATYKLIDATYPKWRMVMPINFKPYINLNPQYLKEIASIFNKDMVLQANLDNLQNSPTIITDDGGCKVIIMPRTIEKK